MIFLIDKLVIFALCFGPLMGKEASSADICALLLSMTISCLGQTLSEKKSGAGSRRWQKILKYAIEALYCFICFFSPPFLAFLPLIAYETVRTRDYPPMIFCGIVLVFSVLQGGFNATHPVLLCLLAVFACIKTLMIREVNLQNKKNRDDSAELERIMRLRNRELEENLQYEIHINTLKERNRIAREIHDNVGHLLSRSLLQTGALSAVCPKDQTALKSGLEDLKDSLNGAMNSIRESVHGICDDSFDMKNEAEKIIMPLAANFSVEFDFDISGEIPTKIKLCFISILKEAVNNIIRHSSGSKASVILREHPSMYQLIVSDNGKSEFSKGAERTEGMGLSSMEERARSVGGIFRINSEKGFTVFVSVRKESI